MEPRSRISMVYLQPPVPGVWRMNVWVDGSRLAGRILFLFLLSHEHVINHVTVSAASGRTVESLEQPTLEGNHGTRPPEEKCLMGPLELSCIKMKGSSPGRERGEGLDS